MSAGYGSAITVGCDQLAKGAAALDSETLPAHLTTKDAKAHKEIAHRAPRNPSCPAWLYVSRQTPSSVRHLTFVDFTGWEYCVRSNQVGFRKMFISLLCLLFLAASAGSQEGVPSKQPAKTAPQIQQILPSYEGQNVSTVEIGGRPDLNVDELKSLLAQQPGQPFSRAKIDASIA